jgi:hypothetical protein
MSRIHYNYISVTGPVDDVAKFKEKANESPPRILHSANRKPPVFSFHALFPSPGGLPEQQNHDWRMANWGCDMAYPGEVEVYDFEHEPLSFVFCTVDSPPLPLFRNVAPLWPTLTFVLCYEDEFNDWQGLWQVHDKDVKGVHVQTWHDGGNPK